MQTTLQYGDIENVVLECTKGAPIYFHFDMQNGGVAEFLVTFLSGDRLLIGRRYCGALVFFNNTFATLLNSPEGDNDLNTSMGDTIYLLPLFSSLFTRGRPSGRPPTIHPPHPPTVSTVLLDELESHSSPSFTELLKQPRELGIEFAVSYSLEDGTRQTHSVFMTPTWKEPHKFGNGREDVVWFSHSGFGAAVTGVGCWIFQGGEVGDDYIYEKMSLYRTGLSKDTKIIQNLIKVFRALSPTFI